MLLAIVHATAARDPVACGRAGAGSRPSSGNRGQGSGRPKSLMSRWKHLDEQGLVGLRHDWITMNLAVALRKACNSVPASEGFPANAHPRSWA